MLSWIRKRNCTCSVGAGILVVGLHLTAHTILKECCAVSTGLINYLNELNKQFEWLTPSLKYTHTCYT